MPGYAAAQSGAIKELFGGQEGRSSLQQPSATTEIAEVVRDQLVKAGIEVPVFEKFEKGTTNYKPILLKVRDAGCEVLLVEGYFTDYVGTIRTQRFSTCR